MIRLNCSIRTYYRLNVQETGSLEVIVTDDSNRPLPSTLIRIAKLSYTGHYKEFAEGVIVNEVYTDNNGKVHVHLPPLNELMNTNEYYAASVMKEGYGNSYLYYIQVYPSINTIFNVYLSPRIEGQPEKVRLFFQPRKETIHEH